MPTGATATADSSAKEVPLFLLINAALFNYKSTTAIPFGAALFD
jgi:hypothetical protein